MNVSKIRVAGMLLLTLLIAGCQAPGPRSSSEYRANQAEASNMRLLGFNDLQARSAYAPELHQQGGRWIAYIGHHGGKPKLNPMTGVVEPNGTSIVDVTDLRNPRCPIEACTTMTSTFGAASRSTVGAIGASRSMRVRESMRNSSDE